MIRPVLTEIGIFLIPFAVYAVYLFATRSGAFDQMHWPLHLIAKLTFAALALVILSLVLLANFSGEPPGKTYVPAHLENGKLIQGFEK
ncbi:MAG: hypothetical protein HY242_02825 [Afipia sp.]|nr:hypothetical protein [Afipia sp.]